MSDQWAPPVPSRPPGWASNESQYQQQQQQQYPPQQYGYQQQQYPPPQYPPPQQYQSQQYQGQYQPQQQWQAPQNSYQQSQNSFQAPQSYQEPQHGFQPPPYPPPQQQNYQQQPYPPPQQYQQSPGQHYGAPPPQQQPYHPQAARFWQPKAGTTWNMVLHDPIELDDSIEEAEVWNIDVFDNTAETVAELHRRGRKVIAYFSGGTFEDWRPDASKFPKSDLGKKLDDWEGEKWVQTSSPAVRQIMIERIELARSKGFDGIDVDNVDGYDHKTGLGLTHESAVDYLKFLSSEAHKRGLACGLKNASDIIPQVIDHLQWIVQEQCVQYGDEEEYVPFIKQNKPVFNVEYPKGEDTESKKCNNEHDVHGKALQKCEKAKDLGFSTIIKNIKLDQWIQVV